MPYLGTNWHQKNTRFSTLPGLLLASTVTTSIRLEMTLKVEIDKGLLGTRCFDYHISASASISSVRAASGYVPFPSKTDTSSAAVTGSDVDFDLINKAHGLGLSGRDCAKVLCGTRDST
jgi:hypothetical protein